MLSIVKGCKIQDPSILYEGYERIESGFAANVNAEKIQELFEHFILLHNEYCFVILEVPTNAKEEPALTSDGTQPLHKDIYYLDGLTPERAIAFLQVFGEWVINDGMSSFGIGIHSGANEIVLDRYNVVKVFTKTPKNYDNFLKVLVFAKFLI